MKHIYLLLFFLFFNYSFSQNKQIVGDTAYWYKNAKEFENEIQLTNFEESKSDFAFRFRNQGQILEIIKDDSTKISGTITNYIYYRRRSRDDRKILYNKEILSVEQAQNIYEIVQNTEILAMPSEKEIKNWSQGFDGIIYILEYADKSTYSFKNYWTPEIQKIPEALKLNKFVKNISDTLMLMDSYKLFKENLPKRNGLYDLNGGVITSYTYSTTYLGYSGAAKLPFGFFASYFTSYLGKKEVNLGASIQYSFDTNGFYHLSLRASKSVLFFKEEKLRDYLFYSYQDRKLKIDKLNNQFQNHQFLYGLYLHNKIEIGVGLDYLKGTNEKVGTLLYASKWFSKPKISTTVSSSIFDNQINYKVDLDRSFNLGDRSPIGNISVGLGYEDFMNYKDLYFRILTHF